MILFFAETETLAKPEDLDEVQAIATQKRSAAIREILILSFSIKIKIKKFLETL